MYRARRPFHPERFRALIETEWTGVLRSKGFFWLATRMEQVGGWSQAGSAGRTSCAGFWWAAVPVDQWPDDGEARVRIERQHDGPFGDRRQELVLIGIDMDEQALTAAFDACLLDDAELAAGPMRWRELPDPFPAWGADDGDDA